MMDIIESDEFRHWLRALRDVNGRIRILRRIERMRTGFFGDARPVGAGLSELRVHAGPGYRIYFIQHGDQVVILLCGGDKDSQPRDIARARTVAAEYGE